MFSFYGLLSGALFVTSTGCAVSAISLIGLAVASGVWCGTAVLSGFLWGVLVVGDHVQHMGEAAVAIAIILAGADAACTLGVHATLFMHACTAWAQLNPLHCP